MANECIPLFHPGGGLTARATAAVTGKRLVKVSGATNPATGALVGVTHAAAGDKTLGVAARDAASGGEVLIEATPGSIVPIACSAAITAGTEVQAAAAGKAAVLAAGKPVGQAVSTTSAADEDLFVRLY